MGLIVKKRLDVLRFINVGLSSNRRYEHLYDLLGELDERLTLNPNPPINFTRTEPFKSNPTLKKSKTRI